MADVKLIVQAVDKASKELRATAKALGQLEGSTKKANKQQKSFKDTLLENKAAIVGYAAAITASLYTVKKVFDFTREGAQLNQLEESFDRMNATVFKTPGLLNQMRMASRGTIKDSQLMAGVLTLTAGAADDVARRFAEASPKLVEIAKAATKLNPTLGDTAFMFESLSLGIKRGSKLILDNLGLNISLGVAHKDFARKLGKTTEELTEQERVLAVLEAAMRQGDQLINQVGNDVESQADSWDRLTTSIGNLSDEMKKTAADSSQGMISSLADMVGYLAEAEREQGLLSRAIQSATGFQGDWFTAIQQSRKEQDKAAESAQRLREDFLYVRGASMAYADSLELTTEETRDLEKEAAKLTKTLAKQGLNEWKLAELMSDRYILQQEVADHIQNVLNEAEEERAEILAKQGKAEWALAEAMADRYALQKQVADHIQNVLNKGLEETQAVIQSMLAPMRGNALALMNEDLNQLGTMLVTVGGRTADQNRILGEAQDRYKSLDKSIVNYTIGLDSLGLSQDEVNEKVGTFREDQELLIPLIDDMGNITGRAATVVKEFTWNEEALTQALFDTTSALMTDKEAVLALGVSFGLLNEQQAAAMLQQHLMYTVHLPALAAMLAEGRITADDATEAMMNLASGTYDSAQEAIAAEGAFRDWDDILQAMAEGYQIRINLETHGVQLLEHALSLISALPQSGHTAQEQQEMSDVLGDVYNPNSTDPADDIFRQHGGPVVGGKPYVVGEAGPELFIPSGAGFIKPWENPVDVNRGIRGEDYASLIGQFGFSAELVKGADAFKDLERSLHSIQGEITSYESGVKSVGLTEEEQTKKLKELHTQYADQSVVLEANRMSFLKVKNAINEYNYELERRADMEAMIEEKRRSRQDVLRGTAGRLEEQQGFLDLTLGGMTSQRNILSGRISGGLGALGLMGAGQADIRAKIQEFQGGGALGQIYAEELQGILEDMQSRQTLENQIINLQGQRMSLAEQLNSITIKIDAGSGDKDMERRIEEAVLLALMRAGIKANNVSRTG